MYVHQDKGRLHQMLAVSTYMKTKKNPTCQISWENNTQCLQKRIKKTFNLLFLKLDLFLQNNIGMANHDNGGLHQMLATLST